MSGTLTLLCQEADNHSISLFVRVPVSPRAIWWLTFWFFYSSRLFSSLWSQELWDRGDYSCILIHTSLMTSYQIWDVRFKRLPQAPSQVHKRYLLIVAIEQASSLSMLTKLRNDLVLSLSRSCSLDYESLLFTKTTLQYFYIELRLLPTIKFSLANEVLVSNTKHEFIHSDRVPSHATLLLPKYFLSDILLSSKDSLKTGGVICFERGQCVRSQSTKTILELLYSRVQWLISGDTIIHPSTARCVVLLNLGLGSIYCDLRNYKSSMFPHYNV